MPGVVGEVNGAGAKKAAASKNQYRRAKKKEAKRTGSETPSRATSEVPSELEAPKSSTNGSTVSADATIKQNDEAGALSADPLQTDELPLHDFDVSPEDPLYAMFKDVFSKYQDPSTTEPDKGAVFYDDDNDDIPDEEADKQDLDDEETDAIGETRLSKKRRKQQNKLSVAELKAIVAKPEMVEWTDPDAPDPRLLVTIKAHRNVVPVPSHWALKREYLSSKRGVEKAHFALPKFIQETGIAEMRDAVLEKQAEASLKQKSRERVQPKMGKLDIDYGKLYEAFFRHQTKPELTRFGEVYYEGKEYETNLRHLRPGELSEDLREALSMPPGAPPPWLVVQQKFGPPPSYPTMKIPGLTAPIPPGADWGFGAGQWGKPAVDDYNRPLFGGDVFGVATEAAAVAQGAPVEKSLWGELQPHEEESEAEEEEEEEDEEDEEQSKGGLETPSGIFTPSGLASTATVEVGGMESIGGEFTLRKERAGTETEENAAPRSAYTILEEQKRSTGGFFGGEHVYDMSNARKNAPMLGQESGGRKRKAADVDVSVDVEDLDKMSKEDMRRRYEEGRQAEKVGQWKAKVDQEDLSAMIDEESRKRLKKDQEYSERRRQGRQG